ncbi:MAG: tyrosine-type recombinase/integrase [Azoarcus sp.]|jgi:integrase|nr:tyrosine-type recombinase/integrase [Azoarcus sp.]
MGSIEKLSLSRIARIRRRGKYSDGGGLYLQVSKNLVKSWIFRYEIDGVGHTMGLGPLHLVTANAARRKARKARTMLAKGLDPLQTRKTQCQTDGLRNKTFDECAAEYIAIHKNGWKSEKHAKQWQNSLKTYASPHFGNVNVRKVDTALVMRALIPIWVSKTETASRLRERIERILSWAATWGYRNAENPARWRGHLQELLPKPTRMATIRYRPSMPYREIGAFFKRLAEERGIGARALAFTILTACRASEALDARWQEIDFAQRVWDIPGERMKTRKPHRAPLSEAALAILEELRGCHPVWIFPGAKGRRLYSSAMRNVLKKLQRDDVIAHGFRASFRVWFAERTTYSQEIAELALAHAQRTQVEEAYQRSDLFERRKVVMQEWATWCISSTPSLT